MLKIRTSSKKQISEITRHEKEIGQKYSPKEEFSSRVTEHPCEYAFTMVSIPKIGLNPKTKYNTPAGVYFYPLNNDYYNRLINDTLPFVSDAPYCGLVKLNWSDKSKWLIFDNGGGSNQTQEALDKTIQKIKELIPDKTEFNFVKTEVEEDGTHYKYYGIDGQIFDWTFFASGLLAERTGTRFTIAWTKLLRELGYVGIYDYGAGVIHTAEKTQLVCLEPSAYTQVNVFATKDLRMYTAASDQKAAWKKEDAMKEKELVSFWKKIASMPPGDPNKVIYPEGGEFNTYQLTKMGLNNSILAGAGIVGDVHFRFEIDEEPKIPDDLDVSGTIYAEKATSIGKNITCRRIQLLDIETIPEGLNLTTHYFEVERGSQLKTIPNDIKANSYLIKNYSFRQLPENLVVPGGLGLYDTSVSKLPNGLVVKGSLTLPKIFGDFSKYKIKEAFPDDLQVDGVIRGNLGVSDTLRYNIPERTLEQVKQFIAKFSLSETYKRWKKLIF